MTQIFLGVAINHSHKMERKQELTMKIYPPLPLVVGKVVVWGGRQNSVCGLSFGRSCGRTIADDSKKF